MDLTNLIMTSILTFRHLCLWAGASSLLGQCLSFSFASFFKEADMNEHMRMSKRERYEKFHDWPEFQAIQQLYLAHRQDQIAMFYANVDPIIWFMA